MKMLNGVNCWQLLETMVIIKELRSFVGDLAHEDGVQFYHMLHGAKIVFITLVALRAL